MILTRDHNAGDFEIHSYEPGKIKINDDVYHESILLGAHLLQCWQPQHFDQMNVNDLESILQLEPQVVLLGTGELLHFPGNNMLNIFREKHIGVEVMSTSAACRTFNVLMSEGRNVIAALLIK